MNIARLAALIGLLLFLSGSALRPYKDPKAVEDAKLAYPENGEDSQTASERYWAIRDAQLTPKYSLQNYGLTFITVAIFIAISALLFKIKDIGDINQIRTPKYSWIIVVLGLAAAIISPLVYVVDLFIGMARDEFPPWADSLGIPLFGVPVIFAFMLICAAFFSVMGFIGYRDDCAIMNTFRRGTRPGLIWHILLGIPLLVSVIVTFFLLVIGQFYYMISSMLWVFFFGLFYAGKQKQPNKQGAHSAPYSCESE